jgi:hypothetical protein
MASQLGRLDRSNRGLTTGVLTSSGGKSVSVVVEFLPRYDLSRLPPTYR